MSDAKINEAIAIEGYGRGAITFHWVVAALVAFLFGVGLYMESLPGKEQAPWINLHACSGLLFCTLVVARLVWRLRHAPPVLPSETGRWSRLASSPLHWLLYVLMLVIGIPGIVTFIWHGRILNLGFMNWDMGIASDRNIFKPAENIHGWLAYALVGLAAAHALAALFHHFWLRDTILVRMVPKLRRRGPATPQCIDHQHL